MLTAAPAPVDVPVKTADELLEESIDLWRIGHTATAAERIRDALKVDVTLGNSIGWEHAATLNVELWWQGVGRWVA